jgi:hypothetical protein
MDPRFGKRCAKKMKRLEHNAGDLGARFVFRRVVKVSVSVVRSARRSSTAA